MENLDLSNISSIQANNAFYKLSDRYNFIPTNNLIEDFAKENWKPVFAKEVKVRKPEKNGFQQHLIRFRKIEENIQIGSDTLAIEIVVFNSHNGESSFRLMLGIYRFVCANGLVIGDNLFAVKINHMKYNRELLHTSLKTLLERSVRIKSYLQELKNTLLTKDEKYEYAKQAITARYSEKLIQDRGININSNLMLQSITTPKREVDRVESLYHTYNTLQENMITGGWYIEKGIKLRRVKPIKSIVENIRVNKLLWNLTQKCAIEKRGEIDSGV